MRLTEIFRLVWLNLASNKFKVILTSTGIIVGSATIMLVIAIGTGGREEVAEQFKNLNAGAIDITYEYQGNDFGGGMPGGLSGGEAEGMAAGGGMPEGMEMPEGGMPEGMEMPGGGMPEGMEMPGGGMPEGMEMPGGGMPEGMEMPDAAEEPGDGRTAEAGGETKTWQIPVGTDVITTLGVSTTFSRLSAGDVIAVLTEAGTDNILKIWIVQ